MTDDPRKALAEIAALNVTPDTGASVAMHMRRIADEALRQPPTASREALSGHAPASREAVVWPEPKIANPDIAEPTGVPYIDGLIHQLLDAQQDINLEANERMSQSLCDASALIDEVETALRKTATLSLSPQPSRQNCGADELLAFGEDRCLCSRPKLCMAARKCIAKATILGAGEGVREALEREWLRWGLEEIVRCTEPRAGNGDRFTCGIAIEALKAAGFPMNAAGIKKPSASVDAALAALPIGQKP